MAMTLGVIGEGLFPMMFIFLKLMVEYISDPGAPMYEGFFYLLGFVVLSLLGNVFRHNFMFRVQRITLVLRKGITGLLYKKVLRLS